MRTPTEWPTTLDLCDHVPGAEPDGCPHYARTVTIRYSNRDTAFRGRVSSDQRTANVATGPA